ncbi:hypothetical protein Q9233_005495 [Columba guinea]|nr:hypothetical protein Q9233_005495 [Columba guinea]
MIPRRETCRAIKGTTGRSAPPTTAHARHRAASPGARPSLGPGPQRACATAHRQSRETCRFRVAKRPEPRPPCGGPGAARSRGGGSVYTRVAGGPGLLVGKMSRYGRYETKVYVGNLGTGAGKSELERAFSYYGPLRTVWIARNPPGFAFVEFEDPRDAEDAVLGLDGKIICGSRVRVEVSTGMPRRSRYDRPPARRPFDPNDRCYECGEKGHYAYDCHRYSRRRRSSSETVIFLPERLDTQKFLRNDDFTLVCNCSGLGPMVDLNLAYLLKVARSPDHHLRREGKNILKLECAIT